MKEKNTQETEINKVIEAKKRRGKYCEKELMEKIVFEKPSKKHWVNFSNYLFKKIIDPQHIFTKKVFDSNFSLLW